MLRACQKRPGKRGRRGVYLGLKVQHGMLLVLSCFWRVTMQDGSQELFYQLMLEQLLPLELACLLAQALMVEIDYQIPTYRINSKSMKRLWSSTRNLLPR